AGGRAADAIGHPRGTGAPAGAVPRDGPVANHGFGRDANGGETLNIQHSTFNGQWSALTPALSPRRGRIIVNRLAKRARLKISSGDLCCSLSPGERVRVRAGE